MMSCGEEAGWYRFQELGKVLRQSNLNRVKTPLRVPEKSLDIRQGESVYLWKVSHRIPFWKLHFSQAVSYFFVRV